MKNRFVHSYWSKPALNERWEVDKNTQTITNMWYFATSVAYLKKLNQEIVLHTDSFGKKLLDHIPYDQICLTLDSMPEWIDVSLWASGKMVAMESESLNSIHIDGDVFIKTKNCLDKIVNSDADVVVQSLEHLNEKVIAYNEAMDSMKHLRFPEGTDKSLIHAYNTGLLCFKSPEFKKLFLDTYFGMAKVISKNVICTDTYRANKFIAPDIIIEQKFMYDLSKEYKVDTLLNSKHESATNIGYQHVIGTHKYPQISNCKRVLKMLDPELYKRCELKEHAFLNGEIR